MEREGVRIIMLVFIDDITITSKDHAQIVWVKESLAKVFKLKDLGPTNFLLGIQINYDRKKCTIAFSQHQYIVDILNRFNMSDCSTVKTPMDPGSGSRLTKYVPNPENPVNMSKVPYMSAVSALMYLAIGTHPDIMYTISKLAQNLTSGNRNRTLACRYYNHTNLSIITDAANSNQNYFK